MSRLDEIRARTFGASDEVYLVRGIDATHVYVAIPRQDFGIANCARQDIPYLLDIVDQAVPLVKSPSRSIADSTVARAWLREVRGTGDA